MQQFYGTKNLNAKPMTRREYHSFRGWEIPADENPDDAGYLVEYLDGGKANHPDFAGYISWSPKDVFEAAYQPTNALSFGHALVALQAGKAVARSGWNGRQPKTGFVPPSREPVIYEGICYILLATGDVAFLDAEDYDLISHQKNWTLMGNEYPAYTDNNEPRRTIKLHTLLLPDAEYVDHVNGNKLDNRRRNLRSCTSAENNANRESLAGASSKYKGVTWDKSRYQWMSAIAAHGQSRTIGRFDSEEDAARAYDNAAKKAYGQFARLNFPSDNSMFLYHVGANAYPPQTEIAKTAFGGENVPYGAYIAMKTAQGNVVPWLASQTDVLANDWQIVKIEESVAEGESPQAA